jgi:predicted DCC family thiol-disulfide oxidoreductase YuxK
MTPETSRPLVLFDGVCNLCESTVQFIIRHDSKSLFRFASLQSTTARRVLEGLQYEDDPLSSVLLVSDGCIYRKSRAALHIARQLDGVWPVLYYCFFWVPPLIADFIYDFVGDRRYKWFGKKDVCWVPDDALKRRFIDE